VPKGRRDVEQALERKGFKRTEGDHHRFVYHSVEGKKSTANTKTSHSGKDISDNILGLMAKQCGLTNSKFKQLVECPLDREGYESILRQNNKL
jgi:predicted RNA binding protein YcfA (HicA-like mRNA interferase family)